MKISKRYEKFVSALLASFGISLSISFFMTVIYHGFSGDFLGLWAESFILGYLIAVPSSMLVVTMVKRVLKKIIIID